MNILPSMVGRPREFDADQVLDAAMRAFWAKGYEATSLADLMEATGLHKGSLYQAFGDKHSLFVQALKRYLEDMDRRSTELVRSAATPLDGIHAVLHCMLDIADADPACPKGCMAVNALVELAPHDCEVQKIMSDHLQIMQKSFQDSVTQAQAAGQIGGDRTPEEFTTLMITFMSGLAAQLKGHFDKAEAHKLLDMQLEALV